MTGALHKNIRKIRTLKNLSQAEFAELFGLSRANIGSYEEGRAQPKMEVLSQMASYFSLSIDDLVNKELSIKDLTQFPEPEHNERTIPGSPGLAVVQVPYLTPANLSTFVSLGRCREQLTLPVQFAADLAWLYQGQHLEHPQGFSDGDILLLKKITPEEAQAGKAVCLLHNKKMYTGILRYTSGKAELTDFSGKEAVLSIPGKG